ncbi:MAG: CHASE4 domain-containing protein [Sphingomonas sp.]|jgi:signal transduction histidine kinase|uniref:CHASE4 domain-containing protein n=1 Tax=Sphingomonas sp. TaxID=28214 RepID=UPI0035671F68
MARVARAAFRRIAALRNPRSLGAKLVLILTAVGLAGSIAITLLLASVITPSFNQLEAKSVAAHVERTRAALGEYASKVESAVRDYGDWNASYDYMAHQTRAFEQESFSPLAMVNLDVNGMAYVANDGRVVIARWRDHTADADDAALRRAFVEQIGRTDFRALLKGRNSAHFFVRLGPVVAAVGVAQVRRSDGTGTPRGLVLMARRITSRQLSDLLQLAARLDLDHAADSDVITPGRSTMRIAVPIMGADGHAVASAAFSVPRDVSTLGRRMLLLAVAGSTLLLLVVLLFLRRMIDRQVLRPLARVESHMQIVRSSGSLGLLEEEVRHDEIGSLGRSFNSMLRQLKDLREQVEVQSFALGRSESAVAVMHNVRNALNPISTILSAGLSQPAPVDRAILDRAMAELGQDDLPALRRAKLLAFVAAAAEAEARDRETRRQQLQIGREAMSQVLDIIGGQQQAAHERPELAACDVTDIIARNATIARYSGGVSIAFSFPSRPCRVMASRVILSQVIGNIFSNAAEAIAATGSDSGTISVTIEERDGQARIAIRDDGEGFAPDQMPELFQRGFSTRAHKSGGLGLHWCANSMGAMHGDMRLESEGKGKGAVAILTLALADAAGQELAA